jgi:hypothetical protein
VTLYSYCLRYDDGAAPNPYHGVCTLVICKPAIRRAAVEGDWVVGLGSARSPIGNTSGTVVYAMKVTQKMSMADYDHFCRRRLPGKIPKWKSASHQRRVGDCVYDFSAPGPPRIRSGVHSELNRRTDLGGKYALLSDHFYYLGDRPIKLPKSLIAIVHQTQGHKSAANARYADPFVRWLNGLGLPRNRLMGRPQMQRRMASDARAAATCAARDKKDDFRDRVRWC